MCCSVHPAHIQGESCQLPSGQVPSVGPAGQDGACSSILGTGAAAKVGMSKIAVGSRLTLRLHLGTDLSTLYAVRRVENSSRLTVGMGASNDTIVQELDRVLQLLKF